MSSFALLYVLCVATVSSFPLEDIGKNALVLKRNARQNTGQPNLVSTQFRTSNISALLDAFYENYQKNNVKGKAKKALENSANRESHIENEVNFSSEDRNNDENNLKVNNHGYIENTGESEEDERKYDSITHNVTLNSDSGYISVNSDEDNERFSIAKDQETNLIKHDKPNSIEGSRNDESDEDYKDADEADYEHDFFDDNETNYDSINEDFTDEEDYSTNEKGESAESDTNTDNDDKYRETTINKVENYNAFALDNNLQDNKIDNGGVINGKLEISRWPEDNDQNYLFTNSPSNFKNVKPNGDWWIDRSSDYSYKPSGKKFRLDSKYSNNRIILKDNGKRNFENDHSTSSSAFDEQSNGLRSGNGDFNYHHKPLHFGNNVQNDKLITNSNINLKK